MNLFRPVLLLFSLRKRLHGISGACCALVPLLAGGRFFPDAILAQEAAPVAEPNFVFDAILVVALFGATLYAICRSGRRN